MPLTWRMAWKEVSGLRNQATGGRYVVQANTIHGGVHFHAAPDAAHHHDLPFMVSCTTGRDNDVTLGIPQCGSWPRRRCLTHRASG